MDAQARKQRARDLRNELAAAVLHEVTEGLKAVGRRYTVGNPDRAFAFAKTVLTDHNQLYVVAPASSQVTNQVRLNLNDPTWPR